MVAERTYEPGVARSSDSSFRLLRYRVDDTVYVVLMIDEWQPPKTQETVFVGYEVGGQQRYFTRIPYEDDAFVWVAGQEIRNTSRLLSVLIEGDRKPIQLNQLREIDTAKMVGPVWCPVANMTAQRPYGPDGAEIKRGTKHFAAGAKLYYLSSFWRNPADRVEVIGHHRGSHRYVAMVVSSAWLENWRIELVYSPHLIRELWPQWSGSARAKMEAQRIVDIFSQRAANVSSRAGES